VVTIRKRKRLPHWEDAVAHYVIDDPKKAGLKNWAWVGAEMWGAWTASEKEPAGRRRY
jgi:hypothetical protein